MAPSPRSAGSSANGFARAALQSCVDVVGWLAPDDSATCTVPEAVRESTALLATAFSFRGYALHNNVESVPGLVKRSGIRSLLSGVLVHCTDHAPVPSDLELSCTAEPDGARLTVRVRATEGDKGFAGDANYRKIAWEDLQALAAADGVGLSREGERIDLRLPWMAERARPA